MANPEAETGISVDAGLTPEGKDLLGDPMFQMIAALGLTCYLIGRFIIGRRDPDKPRKWWDYRRLK